MHTCDLVSSAGRVGGYPQFSPNIHAHLYAAAACKDCHDHPILERFDTALIHVQDVIQEPVKGMEW